MFRGIFLIAFAISYSCFAQEIKVEKVGRELGFMTDMTTYIVRGTTLQEVTKALKVVRIRESAKGSMNKVNEYDFSSVNSIAFVRPLSIPTGIVIKSNEGYLGGGLFGPVWGHFEVEEGDGFFVVKDFIGGSPIFRFGHHTFAQGIEALTSALTRVRQNPYICEAVL
jgi:hypothetical protein